MKPSGRRTQQENVVYMVVGLQANSLWMLQNKESTKKLLKSNFLASFYGGVKLSQNYRATLRSNLLFNH